MRWGRKRTGREIWETFAFLKLQPFFIWEDSLAELRGPPSRFLAAAPRLTPGVYLQGPGVVMLTPRPAWRIPMLPIGARGGGKPPPCLRLPEPGLWLPQDSS